MKSKNSILAPLLTIILSIAAYAAVALYVMQPSFVSNTNIAVNSDDANANTTNENTNSPTACTLEAKVCPDGSSVGRVPPSCDFAPCPVVCGTIAGLTCPDGYTCVIPDTNISDAAGTCVLSSGSNTNTANTNSSATIPTDWKTYTNTTYGYSIQYSPDYAPSGTAEKYQFQKGKLQGDPTHTVFVYAMTNTNIRATLDLGSSEEAGWYAWAIAGFPANGSRAAQLSTNKRQETYGSNTFTVVNYDPGSSANGMPFYYLVHGATVFLIVDSRNGAGDDMTIHTMLASFTPTME